LVSVLDPVARSRDIYIVDVARGVRQRLTFDPSDERSAIWSGAGHRVIYTSKGLDLYERSSDFTGSETPVLIDGRSKDPRQVSPDGKTVLYRRSGDTTGNDIWLMPLTGDRTPRLLAGSPFNENYASFSPDGRAIVYVSDEAGQPEVYVMTIEGAGGKTQISTAGGTFPRWRRDGKEIVYLAPDNTLMSVAVGATSAGYQPGLTHPLFKIDVQPGAGTPFDMTADGSRFIVDAAIPSKAPAVIKILVNWPSLLAGKRP
jgi:Tol biopolymer transport system component